MKSFQIILLSFLMILLGFTGFSQDPVIHFIPNEGQWEAPFLYKGESGFADFFLQNNAITYVVGAADNPEKMEAFKLLEIPKEDSVVLKYHAYRMSWLGGNNHPILKGEKKESYYLNYFLGKNEAQWKSKVPVFRTVAYQDVYDHIDLNIRSDKGLAKYDFVIRPGGNPDDIQLKYDGLDGLELKKGNLVLKTSVGNIEELKPYVYQYINGVFTEVKANYKLKDGVVSFVFPKGYDKSENLILDPTIIFATLTGSTSDNWGFSATYDQQGNLYAAGITNGNGYPTTLGAFQITFAGGVPNTRLIGCDVSISKFDPTGTSLVYSTYLGGSGNDMPHSLVVDDNNELIITGKTESDDFPVTANGYDTSHNGAYDIFITKFNATGTGLVGSTYLGGTGDDGVNIDAFMDAAQTTLKYNYGDNSRSEVLVDKIGNIYLASSTQSADFPTTSSAFSNSLGGFQDGIFAKFNSGLSTLTYATYLGGSDTDAAYVLTLDTAEAHVYVGGGTGSSDFGSGTTSGAWQASYQGGLADGFICRFQNSGSYPLLRTTFIGTSDYDQVYGLKIDLEDGVYALGQSLGNFPVSSGVYSNPGSPQFIIKLNEDLSTREFSSVFGSGPSTRPNISPVAFMVDTCQNIYVSGWASSAITPGSSTNGLPITSDAFQNTTDGSDFYFGVFSHNMSDLLFGSYFGAAGKSEHVDGGTSRFDPDGIVYQAICASCGSGSSFPATPGAYSATKGSNNCNLGAVKIAFDLGSVRAEASADPMEGCAPLTVNFGNNSGNATSYNWDFGDGSTSTQVSPTHTYNNPGTYSVRLAAVNPVSCRTHDTDYVTIVVSDDTIQADFDFQLKDTCGQPHITITNNSTPRPGQGQGSATYHWDFGDGATATGLHPGDHYYTAPGAYNIRLVMIDPDACNSPDTLIQPLIFDQIWMTAGFEAPDTPCQNNELQFVNTTQNGVSYFWQFGDGQSSSQVSPMHTYNTPGTYTVIMTADNPNACNPHEVVSATITILEAPTAAFTTTPLQPTTNEPTHFHNQSTQATHYTWDFGDGSGSIEESPTHQYPRTGEYQVCLTAYNDFGCPSRVCKTVSAQVEPLADLPSGFSPNGDGKNDILFVRGYAIKTMDLKIFNRWGQMVFESHDPNVGWDGTYQGKPQEMDAYGFILNVTFIDGSQFKKQGNVTLLR